MSYLLLDRYAPLVVARRIDVLGAEDMRQMLGDLARRLRGSPEKMAVVYDAGTNVSGRPDAATRQVAATWLRDEEALLVRRCAGLDFAFPSPVSRGVLTAIFWIARPPVPVQVHDSARSAISSAVARVGRQGKIDPAEVIRALTA